MNMEGIDRFNALLAQWLAELGEPPGDPVATAVTRAKKEILYDVTAGTVPRSVKSFADLHDYVDANGYGDAFSWPDLPSEAEDDAYVTAHCNFWNAVQDKLHEWIASGQMKNDLAGRQR